LAAFKPTVLNCFLFRQTDLIPGIAISQPAASFDFHQQRSARKMKAMFSFALHRYVAFGLFARAV
jgi:hypothetical protein